MWFDRPCPSLAARLRPAFAATARQRDATGEAPNSCIARKATRWALVFLALTLVLPISEADAQQPAVDIYHSAAEVCRGTASWPMTLNADRGILCFDGWIKGDLDVSPAQRFKESGLFVVRSDGGNAEPAIALSNLLRERHATVVVYDYCLAACASYFFFASTQTYVLKGALVAWPASTAHLVDCGYAAREDSFGVFPTARPQLPCPAVISDQDLAGYLATRTADAGFYRPRKAYPAFRLVRDSPYITRLLKERFGETGVYPDVMWTLNPKLQNLLKTEIHYEAYPASQAEVDAIAQGVRITLPIAKVIYDP
jgi:hypothetical protein